MTTETTKPNNTKPKGKRGPKRIRTIGTNVGQAIREAQAAQVEQNRAQAASAMRRMAGGK